MFFKIRNGFCPTYLSELLPDTLARSRQLLKPDRRGLLKLLIEGVSSICHVWRSLYPLILYFPILFKFTDDCEYLLKIAAKLEKSEQRKSKGKISKKNYVVPFFLPGSFSCLLLYHAFHHHNLHLSITLTTCTCLSHSPPAPDYIHTHHLHLSTFTHRASIKLLSTVVFWEFLNVHSKHFHAWVSVWFNMAQRTGEPRVLRSRSSRAIPPSSSQTEDTDIRAPLGMSAPATDARLDKQGFLDSILSSMQEQQRLMTFLIERQQQQLYNGADASRRALAFCAVGSASYLRWPVEWNSLSSLTRRLWTSQRLLTGSPDGRIIFVWPG